MRTLLTSATTFNVDPVNGSDANDGLTAPWQTIQHALTTLQSSYDLGGYAVTVACAPGTYTAGATLYGPLVGQRSPASLWIKGSGTAPKFTDCEILPPKNQNCLAFAYGASAQISGFLLNGSNSGQDLLALGQGATVIICNNTANTGASPSVLCFGPVANPANHVTAAFGYCGLQVQNNYSIWCAGHIPQCHLDFDNAWCYYNTNGTHGLMSVFLLDATPFYDSFVHCSDSDLNVQAVAWSCQGGPLPGTVTCKVAKCGIIDTGSGGNPNAFPGTIAPQISTGGQYL